MLVVASFFNWGAGGSLLLAPKFFLTLLQVEPFTEIFLFVRLAGLLVVGFGVGYWVAAGDLERNRSWIEIGAAAKLGVVLLCGVYAVLQPQLLPIFLLTLADLFFAILFARLLWKNPAGRDAG